PHSKRRKIETDNEELRMLWNALKKGKVNEIESGQFLLFFDDVSYLTGDNEQGSKISTLFIRECYLHLFKIIFENINVRRWRITGNPGIGKTFFGYYLLCQLAQQNKMQELLQKAINSVNDNILNFVGETTEDNSASHKIVHIRTNMPQVGEKGKGVEEVEEISEVEDDTGESSSPTVTKPDEDNKGVPFYILSNLDFASNYVYEKVMDVLLANYRKQLQAFVQVNKSISDYGTLRGAIFEQIAHRKLLNGESFKVRPLFEKTTSCFGITNHNLKLIIPPWNKLLFSKPDKVIQTRYCIPIQKNNASFDAFVSPDTFFQMTTAESYPIIKSGLEKYIDKDGNSDINFYFVLSKDLYSSYKPQALHTANRTVLRSKPP
ncbi:7936_t:CDS:2, partial [Diversispora eburnea]